MNIYHKNYSKSENDVQGKEKLKIKIKFFGKIFIKIEILLIFIDLKCTMIQIFESENKKTLVECKDRKLYENQVNEIIKNKKF